MKRTCPECGDALTGRVDKRFCSDYCRNTHHNKEKGDDNAYVKRVNAILRKNRRVLRDLNPDGKASVHKDKLMAKGFDFQHLTNTYKTKTGKVYYFCYEQGYLPLDGGWYALVKKDVR